MAKKQLKITQIKSRIGYSRKAKATLDALGLTKMNKSVILEANDQQNEICSLRSKHGVENGYR